jgi:hypothetical protein
VLSLLYRLHSLCHEVCSANEYLNKRKYYLNIELYSNNILRCFFNISILNINQNKGEGGDLINFLPRCHFARLTGVPRRCLSGPRAPEPELEANTRSRRAAQFKSIFV